MKYSENRLEDYSTKASIGRGQMDVPFAALTILLLSIGVIMVLSASYVRAYYTENNAAYFFNRQLLFAVSGVGIMYVASRFPIGLYRRFSWLLLGFTGVMLVIVLLIGVGEEVGSRRWIQIPGIGVTLQPSEFAKIAVILVFSDMVCKYRNNMGTFRYGILPFAVILGGLAVLLLLEPHMSATIIIFLVGATVMFVGGTRLFWFVSGGGFVAIAFFIITVLFPYMSTRIQTWRDPFSHMQGTGYQIVQSLYAIGSGGMFGLGLGQSRQKNLYLPEEHNDFIFSVVCEELGFVGALVILILFALLITRGYWIALHCRDRYSFLVATGISTLLAIQVALNVAVVTNTIPCTGISLPFFSYGGTALWIELTEMGILLSISRDVPTVPSGRKRGKHSEE